MIAASDNEHDAVGLNICKTQEETACTVQLANPLSRKLNKILEIRLDNDKDILEALKALSEFFGENTLRSRRNLRGEIERRSLGISEEFAQAFEIVKEVSNSNRHFINAHAFKLNIYLFVLVQFWFLCLLLTSICEISS